MGLARFLFLFLLKAVIHPWEMCTLKSEAHLRFFLMEKVSRVTRTPLRNILGQIFTQEGFYSFKRKHTSYFKFFENKSFEVLPQSLTYKPIYFYFFLMLGHNRRERNFKFQQSIQNFCLSNKKLQY